VNVAFALTGVSAPITNLVAGALVAPVSAGVAGTFVDATPVVGTGNQFAYDAATGKYSFGMSTAALTAGVYRFRADLGDGAPRDVDFTITSTSLTLTPPSYNYGNVVIGQQGIVFNFTIRNIGATATSLTMTLGGPVPEFPIVQNTCAGSVAAGASCTIAATFRPMSPGPKNLLLTLTATDGSAVTAMLAGIGSLPAQLFVSPSAGSLGSAPLLTQSPTVGDIILTNMGDQPTGVTNFSLPNPEFRVLSVQCPPSIPGHQSCHVLVGFTPTVLGNRAGSLIVTATPGGGGTVNLSGVGTSPLVINPTAKTFPPTPVGVAGPTQTFTVTNISAAGVTTLSTASSPAAFRVVGDTCAGRTMGSGASCTVTLQWFPSTVGTIGGSLTVNGPPGWTAAAALTGTGL